MKILKILFKLILFLILAVSLIGIGYYFAVTNHVHLDENKLVLSQDNVCIYDMKNIPVKYSDGRDENKRPVSIKDIPEHTKQAFIDTEDKRFYTHHGFDVKRIARALLNNLKAHAFKEGASTISQQLIKNTHLTQEKTLKRKLREWKLTKELEKHYTKDQILEKYVNSIYFGHNCFGLRSACKFYFGKTPEELSLADSAVLAGLIKSPNNYSPFNNVENCLKRKAVVLNAMEKNGSISEIEKRRALETPLPNSPSFSEKYYGYTHFVFEELTSLSAEKEFNVGGKTEIFTYFEPNTQEILKKNVEEMDCDFSLFVLSPTFSGFKAGLSTIGNTPRLPGSLIKPLLVYAPAIEEDILSPATPILDEKINYNGYAPENYDKKFYGYVSAREAMEKSLNIPAVKTLSSLGIKKAASYLQKMNLFVDEEDESLAMALGGMKKGFPLSSILNAYATFANGGEYESCGYIRKIIINGENVYERKNEKTRVFSSESAYLITNMLQGVVSDGTAKKLRGLPFDIAAKTGTVGTEKGNTDAYSISYTTKDCIGIWLGNKDNSFIPHTGGGLPCNVLRAINESIYENYQQNNEEIDSFYKPNNVIEVSLDKAMYYDRHILQVADDISPVEYTMKDLFKKSSIPLKKSTSFSRPEIIPPTIIYKNGQVNISFSNNLPQYYLYKIEKYDYVTHNTVYFGEYLPVFIDTDISENKKYQYSITPIYQDHIGKTVSLPPITTGGESILIEEKEILQKEWWEF